MMSSFSKGSAIYSLDDFIAGSTYSDWIIRWWNHEQDERKNGVYLLFADYDGSLPGTVELPSEKQGLLLCPICYICIDEEGDRPEEKMRLITKHEIDIINWKQIYITIDELDYGPLSQRVPTDFFRLKDGRKAISDGYWLFLKGPFEKGVHRLKTYGSCKSGQIQLSMTTFLNVK